MTEKLPDMHSYVLAEDLVSLMTAKLKENGTAGGSSNQDRPTIHKVPAGLRHGCNNAYDPMFISIGPLHHHRADLLPTEPLKWRFLQDLINRDPEVNSVEKYVGALWKEEHRAKKQYSVQIDLDAIEFIEMLVLDGCFLLEFLAKRAEGAVGFPLNNAQWNLLMLRNDLLLMENQIPFFVIETLFMTSRITLKNGKIATSAVELASHYINKRKKKLEVSAIETPTHHLLHLNHQCELLNYKDRVNRAPSTKGCLYKSKKLVSGYLTRFFYFLVSLIIMCRPPRHRSTRKNQSNRKPRTIPSAKNLKEAGIKFKKQMMVDGEEQSCLNVQFFEEEGMLEIPFLSIQQSTISFFRNLIALEQCCPDVRKPYFTAYATFMDKIIDTPEDVAILANSGIIESKLGTDEDVARLFNNICEGASLNYDDQYLADLYERVNRYCDSDQHRWRAALVNGYFHSPWAAVSVIVALALLLLTLGGTIGTVWQTVYTVKSYYKQ